MERAKKGTVIGLLFGAAFAELTGVLIFYLTPQLLSIFISAPEAIAYGTGHGQTVAFFMFLLSFTHCAAGALRGCGKAVIPMMTLLICWCGIRIVYVTTALRYFPVFQTISWAYPLTWGLSAVILLICLLRLDWTKAKV